MRVGVREYYEKQFATLKTFEQVEARCMPGEFDSDVEASDSEDTEQKQSEFAMKISNYANIVLLVFKVSEFTRQVAQLQSRTWVVQSTEREIVCCAELLIRLGCENRRCMQRSGRGPWRLRHPRLTRCWISWPGVSCGSRTFP